jgi:putative transposase
MNRPRCADTDYVDFLVATPRAVSGMEAARTCPRRPAAPAHDAFTRLLHCLEPDPATLWHEVAPLIERGRGVLVVDDTTLDKPYARKMELVHRHWSDKHHAVVDGINLITLLWTEGESLIPCDWRVFDKPNDGITKMEELERLKYAEFARGIEVYHRALKQECGVERAMVCAGRAQPGSLFF